MKISLQKSYKRSQIIDINIKCGNSLISRFDLHDSLKHIPNIAHRIKEYKQLVFDYKNADQAILKVHKRDIEAKITHIKKSFNLVLKDPKTKIALEKAIEKHIAYYGFYLLDNESILAGLNGGFRKLFDNEMSLSEKEQESALESYANIMKLRKKLDSALSGAEYKNALEWRFELPEVLDSNGDFMGFDLIIGNPPYGVDLSPKDRQIYKNIYNLSSTNTAQLFILLADKITNPNGINTFIVPKSLTYVAKWNPLRDALKSNLYLLADCGKAWSYVLLEMVIYAVHKNHKCDFYANTFLVDTTKNKGDESSDKEIMLNPTIMVDKNLIDLFGLFINNLSQNEINLGVKMRNIGDMLGKYCENTRGVTYQNKLTQKGKYGFIGGKEINRYAIKQYKGFTNSIKNIPNNAIIKDNALLVQNIVTQNRVVAMLPQKQSAYLLDTINQLVFKKLDSRFVWAILNSTAMNWYIAKFIFANAKMTMHFDAPATDKIPIPKLNAKNQKIIDRIIDLVDKILESKAKDSTANTTKLESQIDDLVYQLYDLDLSEIKIIQST